MLEPPSLDARIAAQAAAFTLCSETGISFDRFPDLDGVAASIRRYYA